MTWKRDGLRSAMAERFSINLGYTCFRQTAWREPVVEGLASSGLARFSVDVNRNSQGVPKGAQIKFGLL